MPGPSPEASPSFFPEPGISVEPGKRICRCCPVRQACLIAGLDERHGIWGGLDPQRAGRAAAQAGQTG